LFGGFVRAVDGVVDGTRGGVAFALGQGVEALGRRPDGVVAALGMTVFELHRAPGAAAANLAVEAPLAVDVVATVFFETKAEEAATLRGARTPHDQDAVFLPVDEGDVAVDVTLQRPVALVLLVLADHARRLLAQVHLAVLRREPDAME